MSPRQEVVYNGEAATANDMLARTVVRLFDPVAGRAFCSGYISNMRTIVTAAHCLGSRDRPIEVQFINPVTGEVISQMQTRQPRHPAGWVRSRFVDGQPNPEMAPYDVATLTIDDPIPRGFCAAPPRAEGLGSLIANHGHEVKIYGYGVNETPGQMSGTLNSAQQMFNDVSWGIVTTTVRQGEVCHGDSGGPSFIRDRAGRWRLLGVTGTIETDAQVSRTSIGYGRPRCSHETNLTDLSVDSRERPAMAVNSFLRRIESEHMSGPICDGAPFEAPRAQTARGSAPGTVRTQNSARRTNEHSPRTERQPAARGTRSR